MSAFFLYSQANRNRIKEENPNASFGDVVSVKQNGLYEMTICMFWSVWKNYVYGVSYGWRLSVPLYTMLVLVLLWLYGFYVCSWLIQCLLRSTGFYRVTSLHGIKPREAIHPVVLRCLDSSVVSLLKSTARSSVHLLRVSYVSRALWKKTNT